MPSDPHELAMEATPTRPWPYRWRCETCGASGSAESREACALAHQDLVDRRAARGLQDQEKAKEIHRGRS